MAGVFFKGLVHFDTNEEAKKFVENFNVVDAVDSKLTELNMVSDCIRTSIEPMHGTQLKKFEKYCETHSMQDEDRKGEVSDKAVGM